MTNRYGMRRRCKCYENTKEATRLPKRGRERKTTERTNRSCFYAPFRILRSCSTVVACVWGDGIDENTLYPVRALKKYRISKMDEFEPVLSLDPIEEAADSSRFVGVVQSAEGQEGFSVVEQNSKQESVEELLRQENARLKELGGRAASRELTNRAVEIDRREDVPTTGDESKQKIICSFGVFVTNNL